MADAGAFQTGFFTGAPDPGAMFETANKVIGNQLLGTQAKQAEQSRLLEQMGVLQNAMASIANKKDASRADFEALGRYVEMGLIDPQLYGTEMESIPDSATPEQYRQLANEYWTRMASATEKYGAQYGYGPGAAAQPVTYLNALGATTTNALGNFATNAGVGVGAPADAGARTNPFPLEEAGAGAQPAAGPDLPMPASGAQGFTGPTPQETKMYEASADQFQADKEAAANWQQTKLPLEKMIELLPETATGKGVDLLTLVPDIANTLGIPIGADQSAQLAELKKYAANLARTSGAAANSDNQLAAAFSAVPNTDMNNAAALEVSKTLLSLARMNQAKISAAVAAGVPPERYSDFAQQWGGSQDPLAYGFDLLSPEKRAEVVNNMSDDEFARFQNSLGQAVQLGLVKPPAGGAGG